MKLKKKKAGRVAIPFLISLLVSLVVIGGAALFIYEKIDDNDSSLSSMVNQVGTLSAEENHTILFVVDMSDTISTESDDYYDEEDDEYYDEDYDDEYYDEDGAEEEEDKKTNLKQPYTFMLMRSEPVNKKILFMGIPSNMLLGEENRQAQDIYVDNGTAALVKSMEFSWGIKIDRHLTMDTEGFKKVCNILGGVTFAVPKDVETVQQTDSEQYLSAEQIVEIVSSGNYSGGELQRISTVSSLVTSMTNQASGERIAGNLDNIFETVINMSDSDISAADYNDRKYAIKFMLKYSDPEDSELRSSRAQFLTPYGDTKNSDFIADKYFADDIKVYFDVLKDEAPEASDDESTQPEKTESEKKQENE